MNRMTLITCTLAMLAVGCTDPKAANESNFENAIQSHLDATYPRCFITQNFPAVIEFDFGGQRQTLAALAKAGLVSTQEKKIEAVSFGAIKRYKTVTEYDLTDEGRQYYKADATKNLRGDSLGGFCFGKASITEIEEFTEPADMMGARISRVRYRYEISGFPSWATSEDMLNAVPALKKAHGASKQPDVANAVLILTSNGWQHESSVRR